MTSSDWFAGDVVRPGELLVILQNAWSPAYAGRRWPEHLWLKALANSQTGRRLRVLLDAARPSAVFFANATPLVGATADSEYPPDHAHVAGVIARAVPQVVVACGRSAFAAVRPVWDGPLLAVPHPCSRVLTRALYRAAGRRLATGLSGVVEYRQLRGRHKVHTHGQEEAQRR